MICDLDVPPDAPELTAVIFGNVLTCICSRRGQLPLTAVRSPLLTVR